MKYIANCSGGKDSIATVILAHEHGEPLDVIVYSKVMFDDTISGDLPEHVDFIENKAFPLFEKWGYKTEILQGKLTYMDYFLKEITRGKRKGLRCGFPMMTKCYVNGSIKVRNLKQYRKGIKEYQEYIGIALDEPKRLARLKANQISLLSKYGYTESMAYQLCKEYGLLSPIYQFTSRSGCWFCPYLKESNLRHLRANHRDLWNRLLELEKEPNLVNPFWNPLKKISIHDKERQFALKDK